MNFKNTIDDFIKNALKDSDDIILKIECEQIVKKIFHHRDNCVNTLCKYFLTLKEKLLACKLKAAAEPNKSTETVFKALFGESQHTKHSESYFASASYNTVKKFALLSLNQKGQITDSFEYSPVGYDKWKCNEQCKLDQEKTYDRFLGIINVFLGLSPNEIENFFETLDNCTHRSANEEQNTGKRVCKCGEKNCSHIGHGDQRVQPLGHPEICHERYDSCNSVLLFLRRMSPHFPLIRNLVKLCYLTRHELQRVRKLESALKNGDFAELKEIALSIQSKTNAFTVNSLPYKDESEIYDHFQSGFAALRKKEEDWTIHVCGGVQR